ncbi:MAG TPA: hypothetical protein VF491_14435 [Vicinamibacterales bacterium]
MPSPPRVSSRRVEPPSLAFTRAERALIARLNTPTKVQRWLNSLPYNTEKGGETLRGFRPVARLKTAHCLEAALFGAVVMEQHGYPPLLMSLESQDWLDHVIFIYRHPTGWGSVARSRDPGLHGRKPLFRSPRALAMSYYDGYVDYTGRVKGFGVANLVDALPGYDWRLATTNLWKVEQMLIDWPHRRLKTSITRYRALLARYKRYRADHNDRKPVYYRGRHKWEPIPQEFRRT